MSSDKKSPSFLDKISSSLTGKKKSVFNKKNWIDYENNTLYASSDLRSRHYKDGMELYDTAALDVLVDHINKDLNPSYKLYRPQSDEDCEFLGNIMDEWFVEEEYAKERASKEEFTKYAKNHPNSHFIVAENNGTRLARFNLMPMYHYIISGDAHHDSISSSNIMAAYLNSSTHNHYMFINFIVSKQYRGNGIGEMVLSAILTNVNKFDMSLTMDITLCDKQGEKRGVFYKNALDKIPWDPKYVVTESDDETNKLKNIIFTY